MTREEEELEIRQMNLANVIASVFTSIGKYGLIRLLKISRAHVKMG